MPTYRSRLKQLTAASNDFLLSVVEALSWSVSDGHLNPWSPADVEERRLVFVDRLLVERNAFVGRNHDLLLQGLPPHQRAKVLCA